MRGAPCGVVRQRYVWVAALLLSQCLGGADALRRAALSSRAVRRGGWPAAPRSPLARRVKMDPLDELGEAATGAEAAPEAVPETVPEAAGLSEGASTALLNAVAVLWGTQHAVIKGALSSDVGAADPSTLNFLRFSLAALALSPWLPRGRDEDSSSAWSGAAELSLWMFLGYALQAVGLLYTSASRSAFLLYLNVKLVPILSAAVFGTVVALEAWASAALAALGTALLAYDGAPPNVGDLWSLGAAAASAMFILRLDSASKKVSSSLTLTACLCVLTAALCALWGFADAALQGGAALPPAEAAAEWGRRLASAAEAGPLPILYLGLVTTALTSVLQAEGQRAVGPERAALIYALDPVWGALFAFLALGEALGPQGWAGASLIGVAAVGSQALDAARRAEER